jgi:hypothetical protein
VRLEIRSAKDLFAGLLFLALGLAAVVIGRNYPLGSASRMGPGYFPVLVGGSLILVGLIVGARALSARMDPIGPLAVKPVLLVIGAIALFAASIEKLGLAVAIALVVVVGYLANPQRKPAELLILAAVLTVASVAIFVYGLKLPFKVWPELS